MATVGRAGTTRLQGSMLQSLECTARHSRWIVGATVVPASQCLPPEPGSSKFLQQGRHRPMTSRTRTSPWWDEKQAPASGGYRLHVEYPHATQHCRVGSYRRRQPVVSLSARRSPTTSNFKLGRTSRQYQVWSRSCAEQRPCMRTVHGNVLGHT